MKRANRKPAIKAVTIYDVAEAAGVSATTVSRVLNEKDDVAPETYGKVRAIIDEMGYISSLAARSMRSRRTNVIGLIMPSVSAPYSIEILKGVSRAIAYLTYHLIVYTTGDAGRPAPADQQQSQVALLNTNLTDGVIVVTPSAQKYPGPNPVVTVDPLHTSPDFPAVVADNHSGARSAVEYLIDLGHRRIGFIGGRVELEAATRREEGYREALCAAGIPVEAELVQNGDFSREGGAVCAQKLLEQSRRPTAIFAANDESAAGVYETAAELGLRIPDDLSVVGFDNVPDSLTLNPPLTTVDQFVSEMGYTATMMLMDLLQGKSLESYRRTIPTKLVIRDSCRVIGNGS
jgi:LacI family transcriptional regulator